MIIARSSANDLQENLYFKVLVPFIPIGTKLSNELTQGSGDFGIMPLSYLYCYFKASFLPLRHH
jgi:hypothetical protein